MSYHIASADEIKDGCPPGKAILWVTQSDRGFFRQTTILSGYLVYDSLNEALTDLGLKLQFYGGEYAMINYKSEDGKTLDVWTMTHRKQNAR